MKIDIKRLAKLSNLEITTKEEQILEKQITDFLEYAEKMNSLDVTDVIPTSQVTGLENITFNDSFSDDSLTQEDALSGSNSTHNGMFKVKAVLDNS